MRFARRVVLASICGLIATLSGAATGQEIVPYPREIIRTEGVIEWTFPANAAGWMPAHDCALTGARGVLGIRSTGDDPYLFGPPIRIEGPVIARLRMKCAAGGDGQIFWLTEKMTEFDEAHSRNFGLTHDNQWHDYTVALAPGGGMRQLRLDPAERPGVIEVESIELLRETPHPLEIQSVRTEGASVSARLKNYSPRALSFTMDGRPFVLGPNASGEFSEIVPGEKPFRLHDIVIESPGLPPLHRVVSIVDTALAADWATLRSGDIVLRADRDGSGARLELGGRLIGVLSPLISRDGAPIKLNLTAAGNSLSWRGDGVLLAVALRGDEVASSIQSERPCEGPVLRAFGPLEQGLFPGLEYLATGENSSSTLDIETADHVRFAPDPRKVTMPLMAFVTDRAMTAMAWGDMSLQPLFATPNFLDGPEGHRASLRGTNIECTILIRPPGPIEDAVLWAVRQRGLPPLPNAPRAAAAEMDFCAATLNGAALKSAEGWGHCAEASWPRQPYADQASTVWRLTGQIPSLPRLVPGGSHITDDSIYFLTGRAAEWLKVRSSAARGIIAEQKPDGSFRYDGKFRRGHFEDTASGYCAERALQLLEHARFTGDAASLRAGVKALEFMKHFRDPRGAQTWECPLHAPDILASAYLVKSYVRGFELTGQSDYLDRARAWAITGLPFVYQWSDEPTMAYATIAIFGATDWHAPNWMGLPVQWCGLVYAHALAWLAPLDKTLDWNRVAAGILTTGEQMQYPSGSFAGCEPDSFNLAAQQRNGPSINPCDIVSVSLGLDGKLNSLAVASAPGHRVVAPFPVSIRGNQAHVEARTGVTYQVLVDGWRIVDVASHGADTVMLAAEK
jgi:hypothetical protein